MKCPSCSSATWVLETRQGRHATRRRRECRRCGHRFSTYELSADLEVTLPVMALVAHEFDPGGEQEAKR